LADFYKKLAESKQQSKEPVPAPEGTVEVVPGPIIIKDSITCTGPARVSAVGPNDATGVGALYSEYDDYSVRGGVMGTMAVPRFFLARVSQLSSA